MAQETLVMGTSLISCLTPQNVEIDYKKVRLCNKNRMGNGAERRSPTLYTCVRCGHDKTAINFGKDKYSPTGHRDVCKDCEGFVPRKERRQAGSGNRKRVRRKRTK